jgi:hypothetical protein
MDIEQKKPQGNLICCVKNCHRNIKPGEEIKLDDDVYCKQCGTLILKQTFGL